MTYSVHVFSKRTGMFVEKLPKTWKTYGAAVRNARSHQFDKNDVYCEITDNAPPRLTYGGRITGTSYSPSAGLHLYTGLSSLHIPTEKARQFLRKLTGTDINEPSDVIGSTMAGAVEALIEITNNSL